MGRPRAGAPALASLREPHVPQTATQATPPASSPPAPVRILGPDEITDAVRRLAASTLAAFTGTGQAVENPTKEQIAWHKKVGDTAQVLSKITNRTDFAIGSFFDGEPIGLATIDLPRDGLAGPDQSRSKGLKVVHAVAHPLASGAGSALIERAVALSAAQGYEGKLQLNPMSVEAASAYEALGFIRRGVEMTLTPSSRENADRWVQQDGEWKLKEYLTKAMPSGMSAVQVGPASSTGSL